MDDPAPHLAAARLAVVAEPIGGGFKMKMLEYVFNRVTVASLAACTAGLPEALTASMAVFPDMADDARTLLRLADGALYRAKRSGSATLCIAQPGDALAQVDEDLTVGVAPLVPEDVLVPWAERPAPGADLDPHPDGLGAAGVGRRVLGRVRRSLRAARA